MTESLLSVLTQHFHPHSWSPPECHKGRILDQFFYSLHQRSGCTPTEIYVDYTCIASPGHFSCQPIWWRCRCSGKPLGHFFVSNRLEQSVQSRRDYTYENKILKPRVDSSKSGPPGRRTSQPLNATQTPRNHIPIWLVVVSPLGKLISKGTQRAGLLKLMSRTLPSDDIAKLCLRYVRPVLE